MSAVDHDASKAEDMADDAAITHAVPSPMYEAVLRQVRFRRRLIVVCQILALIVFLAMWEIAPRAHWVNPMLTSYPSAMWPAFVEMLGNPDNNILHHTWVTLVETVVGFTISMVLGILIAVILWWSEFLYRVVDPFLVVANALPKIALVPIFYIWLGDVTSIYAMAVAIALFITILMIYSGFRESDANQIKLIRTFGASKAQILRRVVLPASRPRTGLDT